MATIPLEKRLCFSGHRKFDGSYDDDTPTARWIREQLAVLVRKAVDHGFRTFVSGGALGLDTWAAEEVIRQRDAGADIRLILAIPCAGQDSRWTPESQERYRRILQAADSVHYCSKDNYKPGCMDARDRWMLENVSSVIAFIERPDSGTGRAVKTAISLGRKVIVANTKTRSCTAMTASS